MQDMKDEYKICLMCGKVYEGDIKRYKGKASHGICTDQDCRAAYMMLSFGCKTKEEALSALEDILNKNKV